MSLNNEITIKINKNPIFKIIKVRKIPLEFDNTKDFEKSLSFKSIDIIGNEVDNYDNKQNPNFLEDMFANIRSIEKNYNNNTFNTNCSCSYGKNISDFCKYNLGI